MFELNNQLYSGFSCLLENEPLTITNNVSNRNGLEVWRRLNKRYDPQLAARKKEQMGDIMRTKPVSLANLSQAIEQWEEKVSRYDDSMTVRGKQPITEDIKVNALIGLCPDKLQEHLSLNLDRYTDDILETQSYEQLREFIFTYLEVKKAKDDGGVKPMDLDAFGKGGKGLGKYGGGRSDKMILLVFHFVSGRI